MLALLFQSPITFVILALILIFSIGVHEFSHALIADRLGDPTPRAQGRLTINPLAHLDPIGMLLIVMIGFGWGKPVVYDPYNLKNPHRDSAYIALAGPVSSLLTAIVFALLVGVIASNTPIIQLFMYAVRLNVMLAIFNLIPVYPLDGFRIVSGLLPAQSREEWNQLSNYGIIILILLIFPLFGNNSVLSLLISPSISFVTSLMLPHAVGGIL
ncbi:MAG: site-2 protease family protein [Candidatus Roizmanbacteria bacterium]|nr:site-2 protease family protein [Candidatus Roizmanbacteria bacterium]